MADVCDKFRQNFKQAVIEQMASVFDNCRPTSGFSQSASRFLGYRPQAKWTASRRRPQTANRQRLSFGRMPSVTKITQDDVSIVVPRYDWTLGTVYKPFRPDVEMFNPESPTSSMFWLTKSGSTSASTTTTAHLQP
jgi:hypothetical protein